MRVFLSNICRFQVPRSVNLTLVAIVALAWSGMVSSCDRSNVDTLEVGGKRNVDTVEVDEFLRTAHLGKLERCKAMLKNNPSLVYGISVGGRVTC